MLQPNKTGMSQVGAIPKAQKAQKVFEICSERYETHKKFQNTNKVPFLLGKRLRSSDIACWNTSLERFFLNLLGKLNAPPY